MSFSKIQVPHEGAKILEEGIASKSSDSSKKRLNCESSACWEESSLRESRRSMTYIIPRTL